MGNADYVKSLGLEFKDLTAKAKEYWNPTELHTWLIVNKKTNKPIGSTWSIGKRWDTSVIIGEWLLSGKPYVDEEDQSNKNKDSKALLRYKLNKIIREFVNDTSISGKFLCKNQYAYFNNLQSYVDRVNKLLGKDLCDTDHVPFLNEERKEIYIVYDGHRYTLGSACGEIREVYYDKIYEFVDIYDSGKSSNHAKALLKRVLLIACNKFEQIACSGYLKKKRIIELTKIVNKIIAPAECDYSLETDDDDHIKKYYLMLLNKDKTYFIAKVDPDNDQEASNESEIDKFIDIYLEDTTNE